MINSLKTKIWFKSNKTIQTLYKNKMRMKNQDLVRRITITSMDKLLISIMNKKKRWAMSLYSLIELMTYILYL